MRKLTKRQLYRIFQEGGYSEHLDGRTLVEGRNDFEAGNSQLTVFKAGNVRFAFHKEPKSDGRSSVSYRCGELDHVEFGEPAIVYALFRSLFGANDWPKKYWFADDYHKMFDGEKHRYFVVEKAWCLFGEAGIRAMAVQKIVWRHMSLVRQAESRLRDAEERHDALQTDAYWAELPKESLAKLKSIKANYVRNVAATKLFVEEVLAGKDESEITPFDSNFELRTTMDELGVFAYTAPSKFQGMRFALKERWASFSHEPMSATDTATLLDSGEIISKTYGMAGVYLADVLAWLRLEAPAPIPTNSAVRGRALELVNGRNREDKPVTFIKCGCQRYDGNGLPEVKALLMPKHEVTKIPARVAIYPNETPETFRDALTEARDRFLVVLDERRKAATQVCLLDLANVRSRRARRAEIVAEAGQKVELLKSELATIKAAAPVYPGATCEDYTRLVKEFVNAFIPTQL